MQFFYYFDSNDMLIRATFKKPNSKEITMFDRYEKLKEAKESAKILNNESFEKIIQIVEQVW